MNEENLEFQALGPVAVRVGGISPDLRAYKLQSLVALLLVKVNTVAERDWLIDQLWAGEPPTGAAATLRAYIYQLRKLMIGSRSSTLHGRVGGYVLEVDPLAVDVNRFEAAVTKGDEALRLGNLGQAVKVWREGLGLWRGRAFAGIDVPVVRDRAGFLDDLRVETIEQCISAELDIGTTPPAISELESLTKEHPLREGLWQLLMVSQCRAGRQGEALETYRRLRRLLDEELGVEPSASVEQLHRRILEHDPRLRPSTLTVRSSNGATSMPLPSAPRYLPASVAHFTGREPQLAALQDLLPGADDPSEVTVAVVTGTAGIGKTAFAVRWAHRAADRFPDGQLYLNLRGFDPVAPSLAPAEALRTLLDALGVPPARIPSEVDLQAGMYRSLLAGKRILILLDNARDADQIRPLLPGTPGAFVVVTSRNRLSGLIAQGAHPISLAPLESADAHRFLIRRLRRERVQAEPETAAQIVGACAGLPLALAIVAARAATSPDFPLSTFAAGLRDAEERLDTLADSDPATDPRSIFSWSYLALAAESARMFRFLSAHPGPEVTPEAAAGLVGVPLRDARRTLTELAVANLLLEPAPGRYAFHDLLRCYAAELAAAEDPPEARSATVRRVLEHCLHNAHVADSLIDTPQDPLVLEPPHAHFTPEPLPDGEAAQHWFAAEQAVLTAAVAHAAKHGFDVHCWQLAWTISNHLLRIGRWHEMLTIWRTALDATHRLGDPAAQSRAHFALGLAHIRIERFDEAYAHLAEALDLRERLGDQAGQAHVLIALSRLARRQQRAAEALSDIRRALDLYAAANHPVGQARALHSIGWHHATLGEYEKALDYCRRAMNILQTIDDLVGQAATLDSIGYIQHRIGAHETAIAHFQQALDLTRDLGIQYGEASTLVHLGETQLALGHRQAACRSWVTALRILEDLGHADAVDVRRRLTELRVE